MLPSCTDSSQFRREHALCSMPQTVFRGEHGQFRLEQSVRASAHALFRMEHGRLKAAQSLCSVAHGVYAAEQRRSLKEQRAHPEKHGLTLHASRATIPAREPARKGTDQDLDAACFTERSGRTTDSHRRNPDGADRSWRIAKGCRSGRQIPHLPTRRFEDQRSNPRPGAQSAICVSSVRSMVLPASLQ